MIVSQIRDNIGVTFGKKHTRSGGKALDFYASQVLWLAHIKRLSRTHKKVKRVYGIKIKAKCEKNKISLPFREAEFDILFGYGVDNLGASLDWLEEIGRLKDVDLTKGSTKDFLKEAEDGSIEEFIETTERIDNVVIKIWQEIEEGFLPKRRKY